MSDGAPWEGVDGAALLPTIAGIVAFKPDEDHLVWLAGRLLEEADRLVIVLNSAPKPALRRTLEGLPRTTLRGTGENVGIGSGLNVIAEEALRQGAGTIVFFDQDSTPPPHLIGQLRAGWLQLLANGERPGVISPLLVAEPGSDSKAPTYRFKGPDHGRALRPVAFVPTSGSLVSAEAWHRVGAFRGDFFIDGVDLEWSFRAAARGLGCWVDTRCVMTHAVGSGTIGAKLAGWRMPKQRPFRMYCLLRNTLYGLRLSHVPLGWKLRQIGYLPIQTGAFALHHRLSGPVVRLLWRGLVDGISGRLGPPPVLPD